MNFRTPDAFCSRWSAGGHSSWWLPLTDEGRQRIEGWVQAHDLWKKVERAYKP